MSNSLKVSDATIVSGLQAEGQRQQDEAFRQLYRQFYVTIEQLVIKNSGDREDAADIFQDGLMVLFRKVREVDFQLTASLKTLLYAICRNLWLMRLRKRKRETQLTEVHSETIGIDASVFQFLEDNNRNRLVAEGLAQLGEDCQKVLRAYYFERTRMKIIAEKMGYTSEQVAKNKKSRCMKKLREWLIPRAEEL